MAMRSIFVGFVFLGSTASMADVAAIAADCDGCHGADGVSEWSDMPTIAGISEFVLSDAMFYYRDGDRPCVESEYRQGDTSRPATDMCKVAEALSEDDIDAISAHYAGLPFKPAAQEFDAELAAAGEVIHDQKCDACHSNGGRDPLDDAGILGGQWKRYLGTQFEDYAAGERSQPAKMAVRISALSPDDVAALLSYYASLQ